MNPKKPSMIRATLLVALSLPLAGCGNKGPLVLPPNPPPVEADAVPVVPPADDASLPVDSLPEEGTPPTPTDDAPVPPTAASDDGNG
ncbi:MAG: LPS translocon maturation chaperone LptM [Lysobacter sp.]